MTGLPDWEPATSAAVIGLVTYQIWGAWRDSAPSLQECRDADLGTPGGRGIQQHLWDADLTVGSLAVMIGLTIAVLTRNATALVLILIMFGGLSFWHHDLLRG
jgi:hypothetical protein